jgi:hypothetical protein
MKLIPRLAPARLQVLRRFAPWRIHADPIRSGEPRNASTVLRRKQETSVFPPRRVGRTTVLALIAVLKAGVFTAARGRRLERPIPVGSR